MILNFNNRSGKIVRRELDKKFKATKLYKLSKRYKLKNLNSLFNFYCWWWWLTQPIPWDECADQLHTIPTIKQPPKMRPKV